MRKAYCALLILLIPYCASAQILSGADLSIVHRLEHDNVVFRDNEQAQAALTIFHNHGYRIVRLRLWHSPSEPWHGTDFTLAFAQRAVNAGFDLLLDFHYSDSWADPAQQTKPAAWQSLSFTQLTDSVYAYTNNVIRRFRNAGVIPEYVQIGNEITGGMLWNDGCVNDEWNTPQQWQQFASLLNAGIRGTLDSLPTGTQPKIILHVDDGGSIATCRWFFDHLAEQTVVFDVIGLSYYPWWHGPLDSLRANLSGLASAYGKEIQIVETAYPWTLAWNDNEFNPVGSPEHLLPGYPASPQGQADFLRAVREALENHSGGLGTAAYYWEPAWVCAQTVGSPWENVALFDFTANALPGLDALPQAARDLKPGVPSTLELSEFYPNPFNSSTNAILKLPRAGWMTAEVFDLLGRKVETLARGFFDVGTHSLLFNPNALSSGTYIVRVQSQEMSQERKVTLIR